MPTVNRCIHCETLSECKVCCPECGGDMRPECGPLNGEPVYCCDEETEPFTEQDHINKMAEYADRANSIM